MTKIDNRVEKTPAAKTRQDTRVKPQKLNDKELDSIAGGLTIKFHDILISS